MLCFYVFKSLLDDREEDFSYEYMAFLLQTGAFILQNTKSVSLRITGYVENIIPLFSTDIFRYHYRISSEMFEETLTKIGACLT